MTLYSAFATACATLYCEMRGDKMMKHFKTLERNQWRPREELDEITNRGIEELMRSAYANVPYYRQVFDERGLKPADVVSVDDLQKLPIFTKDIIRTRFDDLINPEYRDALQPKATGGSTAEPMKFALDPTVKQWGRAAALRSWAWAGYHLGDKQLLLWGATFDLERLYGLRSRIERTISRVHLLNGHIMSNDICSDYVAQIRRFRPKMILAYANSLYILASHMNRNNIRDIRPEGVVSAAETLTPQMRTTIEEALQCKVHDAYASRETSLYAAQCEHAGLYHISSDTTVMEIAKSDGPAAPGEMGKILVTDLKNHGMPFIRYQIEDVAVAGGEPCRCGRSLPTFKSVEGRMSNIITLSDGRVVDPIFMMYMMYRDPAYDWQKEENGILQYQIIQKTPSEFVVRIVREEGTNFDLSYIPENFKKHLGGSFSAQLEFVDEIPLTPSGKRQYVISDVPLEL